ncbi:sulfur carrier protein ThiS [Streptomyces sp. DH8]|uniref:sulfur carrier protein ThiS n=1 Tax=Streptomyces sp. DH8 TaxID=2857008 RepID=UPI001E43A53E|nr:sulfur carrier protein ThiS [Streptomyces sp. DH8]
MPEATVPEAAVPEAAVPGTVSVSVNGEVRAVPAGTDLGALVATLTRAPSGVAAAVNESVVPRGRWAATPLGEGDRVEVLTAVQGG